VRAHAWWPLQQQGKEATAKATAAAAAAETLLYGSHNDIACVQQGHTAIHVGWHGAAIEIRVRVLLAEFSMLCLRRLFLAQCHTTLHQTTDNTDCCCTLSDAAVNPPGYYYHAPTASAVLCARDTYSTGYGWQSSCLPCPGGLQMALGNPGPYASVADCSEWQLQGRCTWGGGVGSAVSLNTTQPAMHICNCARG
jgi:hypothetical protein